MASHNYAYHKNIISVCKKGHSRQQIIKNHKDDEVTVRIQENLTDDWEIIASTYTYEKIDAYTIQFDIPVPPDEEVVVEYSVRVIEPQKEPEYIPLYYPASEPYYY
ncbi:MAG: hypothetical protein ACMUIP_14250 [bacterium]